MESYVHQHPEGKEHIEKKIAGTLRRLNLVKTQRANLQKKEDKIKQKRKRKNS